MKCCENQSKEGVCGEDGCGDGGSCKASHEYSNGLAAGTFVVLTFVSMGIYLIYWFYRNWKHIKEYTKTPLQPVGRTIAAALPVVDIVLFCLQLKYIHGLAKKQDVRSFPLVWSCVGVSLLFIVAWAIFAATLVSFGPDLFMLFYVYMAGVALLALVLLPAQLTLNALWERVQDAPTRDSYTNGEKAWLVVGALFMFFDFISIFILPPPPFAAQPPLDDYPQEYSEPLNITPQEELFEKSEPEEGP